MSRFNFAFRFWVWVFIFMLGLGFVCIGYDNLFNYLTFSK